jgi:hypothetical protein
MADRYQDRAFAARNDYDRDGRAHASTEPENDPLAELARLIGQTDPFGSRPAMGRANLQPQPQPRPADPRPPAYDSYAADPEPDEAPPPAPPSWMQRAVRQAPPPPPQDDYPDAVHPLHRYSAAQPPVEPDYGDDPHQSFADPRHDPDLSRYDEALYGGFDSEAQNPPHDQNYADDGYAYEDEHQFEAAEEPRRRGGMVTVFAVLALAVFGVGGAFAYRTYTGSARRGEPPIIRADAGPTKIIPASADASTKVPDRMATGDGTEKIVSREETPIDPATRSAGPRVVFPPLNQNGSAQMSTGVVPGAPPAAPNAANGTFTNGEPHKIRTFSVRGEQSDAGVPAGAPLPPAPAAPSAAKPSSRAAASSPRAAASNPNTASANTPLALAPQAEASAAPEPPVRMAATNPTQIVPSAPSTPSSGAAANFLVQISSQRSEADAQASFKALQSKFPSVLGSRAAVIKRADLGDKGVYYRAMVGPFGSPEEASQFCGSLKSAGGQCVVQRN